MVLGLGLPTPPPWRCSSRRYHFPHRRACPSGPLRRCGARARRFLSGFQLVTSIALVGLPGSGKSTIGKLLSRRLGLPFVDSDQVIEERLGCSIRAYWEQHGEDAFRDIEQEVLGELTQPGLSQVLATGGGSVLREVNRQRLRAGAYVVYLRTQPDQLLARVRHDRKRPLLQVDDPMERLRSLYELRDPLYREAAHLTVDTGRPSVQSLVHLVQMQLELAGIRPAH